MITRVRVCEGSGENASRHSPVNSSFNVARRVECPKCGREVSVNKYGTLRKHDNLVDELILAEQVRLEDEVPEPVHSILEMRDNATKLKTQLWHTFSISHDPRYKRLWQMALALETHLARMHSTQSFGSIGVQLMALHAGDVE